MVHLDSPTLEHMRSAFEEKTTRLFKPGEFISENRSIILWFDTKQLPDKTFGADQEKVSIALG